MPVTIRDVAKRLNLSITTVSRALDGYDDVSQETRQRVIRTAREMGYLPSRAARQLRRKRADVIGFVMPTDRPRFADPFFSEFISGLGDQAASQDYDLMVSLAPPGQEAEKKAYQNWVQSRRVDGIILSRMRLDDWRVRYLSEQGFPFVAFGRTRPPINFPHIGVDGEVGMSCLIEHLVERGHRRIAFVTAPVELTLQADRFAGYKKGLAQAGINYEDNLVVGGNLTREGGYKAAKVLLSLPEPPTAIIGANDLTALGVIRLANELGLVVGRELAIAGFDGTEAAEHASPPLTTLEQPVYEIARRLVNLLIKVIDGEQLVESALVLQPELIVRASTAG